jgi:UDP-N-acetylmuramyl pentapeptide phosphotransferase/UDP-N-acetylglucosamine-1-phosphate transferase
MTYGLAVLIAVLAALAAAGATGVMVRVLARRRILDHPNERSSHVQATPRGAGLAVVPTLLIAWAVVAVLAPDARLPVAWVLAGALLLAAVSWRDDLKSLPALPRLAAQAVAVLAGLMTFGGDALVLQGLLPFWADRLVAALAWLWFVNLFNFMDGIDGLAGTETAAIGLGLALLVLLVGGDAALFALALALAGATLGFLPWNWHPARIFLGDVGSVPLGYLLGWLLLSVAAAGYWAAALILPLYYLADATLTLLRRLVRGERVWQAHREHFYQRATQAGRSHGEVAALVAGTDAVLIALALGATRWPWPALAAAAVAVGLLLAVLARRKALPAQ